MQGKFLAAILISFCLAAPAAADARLPAVFKDHMVLQRELPIPVWGWAEPGEKVIVTLGDQSQQLSADRAGRWRLKLAAMKAGGTLRAGRACKERD